MAEQTQPTPQYMDRPRRRAKDFVKCVDPECWMNKQRAEHNKRYPKAAFYSSHCHPVF